MNARRTCFPVQAFPVALLIAVMLVPLTGGIPVQTQEARGHPAESGNMRLVGRHDLQARAAYQPVIQRQGERWIAYVGLQGGQGRNPLNGRVEWNGTMIVDVTDPFSPVALFHIPGAEDEPSRHGSGAQMNRVCRMQGRDYLLRSFGHRGQQLWDVSDPEQPRFLRDLEEELSSVHKSWWQCDTGIAYVVASVPGWRTRLTRIYDLSDPAAPVFIRDFGLPGQQPGAVDDAPVDIHGPIVRGDRVYFGYGSSREGVVQIVDREKLLNGPAEPSVANLRYPEIGSFTMLPTYGAHTTFPVMGVEMPDYADNSTGRVHDFLVVPSESTRNECREARDAVFFFDITFPETPMPVSSYQVREADGDFCQRGGRFGPHAVNESMSPVYYGKVVFVSYFNAGVRAVDIRDPFHPREIAYYIPATTANTAPSCIEVNGAERCKVAVQTNNVEVDDRGYVYIVDRARTGMHILELTSPAREIANYH